MRAMNLVERVEFTVQLMEELAYELDSVCPNKGVLYRDMRKPGDDLRKWALALRIAAYEHRKPCAVYAWLHGVVQFCARRIRRKSSGAS